VLANLVTIVLQVRSDAIAADGVNRVDQAFEMQLDAAHLAQRSAGRAVRRSFHTLAAHLLANLGKVFRKLTLREHGPPHFQIASFSDAR
jgi:hypothetical protein